MKINTQGRGYRKRKGKGMRRKNMSTQRTRDHRGADGDRGKAVVTDAWERMRRDDELLEVR